jgi:3-oxoacyl-[acyl-carrier protein] reductase
MSKLAGRVALVTGAARGIGAAIADLYEAEGAFVYRGDILAGTNLALDVTDRDSVRAGVERIRAERGGLDILVNNAGLICSGPPEALPGEDWDRLVAVNLTGIFNCVQAALPAMQGRAGAAVVNIASVSAEKGGGAIGNVWYGATKAGVVAITKGLGRELAPRGIRVNAISPALLDTDMTHEMLTPEVRARVISRIPLGRLAEKADIARMALFLASEECAFVTGETVAVDGGFLRA